MIKNGKTYIESDSLKASIAYKEKLVREYIKERPEEFPLDKEVISGFSKFGVSEEQIRNAINKI